jgi:hypothetical protein
VEFTGIASRCPFLFCGPGFDVASRQCASRASRRLAHPFPAKPLFRLLLQRRLIRFACKPASRLWLQGRLTHFPCKAAFPLLLQGRLTYFFCKAALPAALRDPRPQHACART